MRNTVRAAIYARFSCEKQRDASIEDQLEACTLYCEDRGYRICAQYTDYAMSGRSDDRPQFQMMLEAARTGAFDVVVVWSMNRFARNQEDLFHHTYTLRRLGVTLESTQEDIAGDSIQATTNRSIHALFDQIRSQEQAIDVMRGMTAKARKCQYLGNTWFGYGHDGDAITVNEGEAALVREMHERYLNGEGAGKIARWLASIGVRTVRGNKPSYKWVWEILANDRYCGVYQWGWEKDPRGRKITDEDGRPVPLVRVEDGIPAIVSKECKAAVRERMGLHRHYDAKHDYPLSGKLVCGVCGKPMHGECYNGNGGEYTRYVCRHKKVPCIPNYCWTLEEATLRAVRDLLGSPEVLERLADLMMEFQRQGSQKASIRAARKDVEKVDRQIQNLVRAVEDGMPWDEVRERMDALKEQKASIRRRIRELEAQAAAYSRDDVVAFLRAVSNGYMDDADLLAVAVSKVFLHEDHVEVVINMTAGVTTAGEVAEAQKKLEPPQGFEQVTSGSPYRIRTGDLRLERAAS